MTHDIHLIHAKAKAYDAVCRFLGIQSNISGHIMLMQAEIEGLRADRTILQARIAVLESRTATEKGGI